ncbi:proliferating cell nuclear antigen [Phlyctema vagabunda]|uniref:Vezatin n=1 Tax=Phlyctema vagabunda TaxID=108571 RepID=A0ABR4PNC0_9HELO
MESVIYDGSPLADYLEGEAGGDAPWTTQHEQTADHKDALPEPSFAPRGKPAIPFRFRQKLPPPLRLTAPQHTAVAAIHNACSRAVNSRLGRADNERFLERFRYIIVASQLLNTHSFLSQGTLGHSRPDSLAIPIAPKVGSFTLAGAALTALGAFVLAWLIHWARGTTNNSILGRGRIFVVLTFLVVLATVSYAHMRRQWLQYLRQQTLVETSEFISKAQGFDEVASAALTLVQEVELVSRGYRISSPLPPISRLEDRCQTRRCARLRRTIRLSFVDMLPRYKEAFHALQPYTEPMDLEKYYDVYDISDLDFSEAMVDYTDIAFEDEDSLRVLKILAARLHTLRKVFLSCLLALDAHGGKPDFVRWSTAVDEVHATCIVTRKAEERLRSILSEEETFPVPPTPKLPLSPSRERWRAQLRKLNSLSSGIRGLQAKLHVLREESDRNLNDSSDVSELGTNLMIQYESIGIDLKGLMQEWEDGKAALASNIDRNERRISSMSGILSPTISLSGLTAVEEGGALDALRALNGEDRRSRSSLDFSSSDAEEVFEAVALPRQRSTLTREQRIIKMKEDRVKRESTKDRVDANTHMLRELESVINLRPRGRRTPAGRITSI